MKTQALIALLSTTEQAEFAERLQAHHRPSLLPLYNMLVQNAEADKATLYHAYSGKKYKAADDFLLRNELRLLNRELEAFVIANEAAEKLASGDIHTKVWLLQRMLKAKQYRVFENTLQQHIKEAVAVADFFALHLLQDLHFAYHTQYGELNEKNYLALFYEMQHEDFFGMHIAEEQSQREIRKQFLLRTMNAIAPGWQSKSPYQKSKAYDKLQAQQQLLQKYNLLNAELYVQHGKKKIETLKELAMLNPKVAAFRPSYKAKLAGIYGNMGIEYFIMDDYTEADKYYQLAIKSAVGKPQLDLLFNYATNLMAQDKFDKFLALYKSRERDINAHAKTKYRFRFFAAIAYLFAGQPNQAFKLLEHDISQRPLNEYYYYRQVYAMVYFETGDIEAAQRELENIQQSYRKRPAQTKNDKPITAQLLKFVQAEATKANKERYKAALLQIQKSIADMAKQKVTYSVMAYKWLHKKIAERLKKVR